MSCPRCGYDNPPNTQFCARCNLNLLPDGANYHPNEQMKVILPAVAKPIERVNLQNLPPAEETPLETVIIAKPVIPPAVPPAPAATTPAAPAPQATPAAASPSVAGPSMAPVLPAGARVPTTPAAAPGSDNTRTVVLQPGTSGLPSASEGGDLEFELELDTDTRAELEQAPPALAVTAPVTPPPVARPEQTPAAAPPDVVPKQPAQAPQRAAPQAAPQAAAPAPAKPAAPQPTAAAQKPAAAKQDAAPEITKQATNFSIAIGTASVVLLIVAISYYVLELRGDKPAETGLPPVEISAPAVAVADSAPPAPAPTEAPPPPPAEVVPPPAEPAPPAAAEAIAPPPPPPPAKTEAAPAATAATPPATAAPSGPRMLTSAETAALLKELKKRPVPRDCGAASQMLISEHAVLPKQAGAIAKRAYPDLCAPPPKPVPEVAPARPVVVPARPAQSADAPPPPPPPKAKTVDDLYEERINAECSKGAFGHICRETIRLKLCSGKLSDNPPAGQTVCKQ